MNTWEVAAVSSITRSIAVVQRLPYIRRERRGGGHGFGIVRHTPGISVYTWGHIIHASMRR
jgi:hypothetical protein